MTTAVRWRRPLFGTALASALCTALPGAQAVSDVAAQVPPRDMVRPATAAAPSDAAVRRAVARPDTMTWPVDGDVTSDFGPRSGRMHRGIDIAAPTGTPIRAAQEGVVSFAGWKGGYGHTLEIRHGRGRTTRFAHQSELLVTEGQRVREGQLIGRVGSTGSSTGPHLHFEVHESGSERDPLDLLPAA